MVLYSLGRAWEALGGTLPSLSQWGAGPLMWGLLELASLALCKQPRGGQPMASGVLWCQGALWSSSLYPGGCNLLTGYYI